MEWKKSRIGSGGASRPQSEREHMLGRMRDHPEPIFTLRGVITPPAILYTIRRITLKGVTGVETTRRGDARMAAFMKDRWQENEG